MQELAVAQLSFTAGKEDQASIVLLAAATMQRLWHNSPSLAGLHAQLHCSQQELSVCFWLLRLTAQLPAVDIKNMVIHSRDDAITAVADALRDGLIKMLTWQPSAESFHALKLWQETVHAALPHFSARQSHGYRKALLVAGHCISVAEPVNVGSLHQLLRTVVDNCNQSPNQPGWMQRLFDQNHNPDFDITTAMLAIVGDVVQDICCTVQPSNMQLQDLRAALRLAFNPALKAPSGWQDHLIAQVLNDARPKQLVQAVQTQIEELLSDLLQHPMPVLLSMPSPLLAELVYLPPFMCTG